MTSRPLYVPQTPQARWGTCFEPHCWHATSVGGAIFHCALRRRVRDRDIFFLGTAMRNLVSGSVSGTEQVLQRSKR